MSDVLSREQVNKILHQRMDEQAYEVLMAHDAVLRARCETAEHTLMEAFGKIDGLKDQLAAAQADVKRMRAAVENEPELPGDMPQEMYDAVKEDKDAMAELLRIVVRKTKENILAKALATTADRRAGDRRKEVCD